MCFYGAVLNSSSNRKKILSTTWEVVTLRTLRGVLFWGALWVSGKTVIIAQIAVFPKGRVPEPLQGAGSCASNQGAENSSWCLSALASVYSALTMKYLSQMKCSLGDLLWFSYSKRAFSSQWMGLGGMTDHCEGSTRGCPLQPQGIKSRGHGIRPEKSIVIICMVQALELFSVLQKTHTPDNWKQSS